MAGVPTGASCRHLVSVSVSRLVSCGIVWPKSKSMVKSVYVLGFNMQAAMCWLIGYWHLPWILHVALGSLIISRDCKKLYINMIRLYSRPHHWDFQFLDGAHFKYRRAMMAYAVLFPVCCISNNYTQCSAREMLSGNLTKHFISSSVICSCRQQQSMLSPEEYFYDIGKVWPWWPISNWARKQTANDKDETKNSKEMPSYH